MAYGVVDEPEPEQSAFRAAEKKYQLHKDQIVKYRRLAAMQNVPRCRKGRACGAKLIVRPTDLSDVIDVAAPSSNLSTAVESHWSPVLGRHVFSFPARPGLYLIPGALEPPQQQRLVVDALTLFPQPPNHTNFTAQHGPLPEQPSLWEAAQRGLCLQQLQAAGVVQQGGGGSAQASAWVASGGRMGEGAGPAATKLLRKLRWATLGPPFDWTQRVYRRDLGYRPLPQDLSQLAVRLAAAVAELSEGAEGGGSSSGSGGSASGGQVPMQRTAWLERRSGSSGQLRGSECGVDAADGSAGNSGGYTIRAPCSCDQAGSPYEHYAAALENGGSSSARGEVDQHSRAGGSSCKPFLPDVALVNYYHAGDTLGGHVDDAELDLGQPIVTLSLGCEAVFLAGGLTRDTSPLALLLRSGDAVVMAGQARRCFHGVPRIFSDRPLPQALELGAGGAAGGEGDFAPFAEYMRSCRVNISVRAGA